MRGETKRTYLGVCVNHLSLLRVVCQTQRYAPFIIELAETEVPGAEFF